MSTISYKQNSLRRIFILCLSMLLMACGGGGSATPTGLPELTVDSPSLTEGNAGSTNLTFIATLSQTDAADVSVDIATADITAEAGSDYSVLITTVTVPAGATQASFSVPVSGDTDIESDESFAMNLTNISSNANLVTTSATGMILNDDSIPAAPSATLIIQSPKGIQLSWNSVSDATYYQVFKNPDGVSGFSIIADNLTGLEYTDTVAVHLYGWLNARYLVTACNASGCDQSNELTTLGGATASIGYFKPSNTNTPQNGLFGMAIALSDDGRTLAVGSPTEASNAVGINGDQNNTDASDSGAVYVFRYDGSLWVQEAYIKASNAEAQDRFGVVAVLSADGNVLAVRAREEDSNATGVNGDETDNSVGGAGAAYVFTRTRSAWLQQAYIKATNTELDDIFGGALALSGDGLYLAVGAPNESSNATDINGDQTDNSVASSGAVYLY